MQDSPSRDGSAPSLTVENRAATIRLNRPHLHNRLTPDDLAALDAALTTVERDRSLRALVLTGSGRSFCSGFDIGSLGKGDGRAFERLADRLDSVPPRGETVQLVFVGNHCKGAIFEDGASLVTPALTKAIDRLVRAIPEFHFGRIDVRFTSTTALRRGTGFRVIEINGAGSEPTHIWDSRTRLLDAWRSQFFHYAQAFRIGAANRRRGFSTSGLRTMYRDWKNQRRLMAIYPMND